MQVASGDIDPTLYLSAINYNIGQLSSVDRAALSTTLGIALTTSGGITTLTSTIEGLLTTAGILPLKVTAAALAVCTTDSIPAGTYTGLTVATAGAPLP